MSTLSSASLVIGTERAALSWGRRSRSPRWRAMAKVRSAVSTAITTRVDSPILVAVHDNILKPGMMMMVATAVAGGGRCRLMTMRCGMAMRLVSAMRIRLAWLRARRPWARSRLDWRRLSDPAAHLWTAAAGGRRLRRSCPRLLRPLVLLAWQRRRSPRPPSVARIRRAAVVLGRDDGPGDLCSRRLHPLLRPYRTLAPQLRHPMRRLRLISPGRAICSRAR